MREVADRYEHLEQEDHDEVMAGVEVQLALGLIRPLGEPAFLPGDHQPDCEQDQDEGLEDPLDDDHLDEGVMLAAHAVQLAKQAPEVVGSGSSRG